MLKVGPIHDRETFMGLTKDTENKLNEIIDKGTSNPPTPAPYLEARLKRIIKGLSKHDSKNGLVIQAQQVIEKTKDYDKFTKGLTEIAGIVNLYHRNPNIPISGVRRDVRKVAEIMWMLGYIKYKYFNLNYRSIITIGFIENLVVSIAKLNGDSEKYIRGQIKRNRTYFLPPSFSIQPYDIKDIPNDTKEFCAFLKKNPDILLLNNDVGKLAQEKLIGGLSIILNFPDLLDDYNKQKNSFMSLFKTGHRQRQDNLNCFLFQRNLMYEYALMIFKNENKIKNNPAAERICTSFRKQALIPELYTLKGRMRPKSKSLNEKSAKTMIDRIYRNLYTKVPADVANDINQIIKQNNNVTYNTNNNFRCESSLGSFSDS